MDSERRENGAAVRIRTGDLLITNQLLYRLSYSGTREDQKRTPNMAAWGRLVNGCIEGQGVDFTAHPVTQCLINGLVLLHQTKTPKGTRSNTDLPMVAATSHVRGFDLGVGKSLKEALFDLGRIHHGADSKQKTG